MTQFYQAIRLNNMLPANFKNIQNVKKFGQSVCNAFYTVDKFVAFLGAPALSPLFFISSVLRCVTCFT